MQVAVLEGALDGTRNDVVIYFASGRWDGPPGTDRHMAHALSRYRPLLYVDPPVSPLTRLRRRRLAGVSVTPALRVLSPRVAHLVPRVTPGITRPGLHHLVTPLMRRAVRSALARLYGPPRPAQPRLFASPSGSAYEDASGSGDRRVAALVSSRVQDVWSAVPARRTLFYSIDDLIAGADLLALPPARLLRDEARTLDRVDIVAAISTQLQRRYAEAGHPAALLPNGCAPDAYASVDDSPVPSDVDLPGPVAGFVGHINHRIDLALLEAVADAGYSLLMVGPRTHISRSERFAALTARRNVCWVGPKPFAELPGYLRVIDVGLTPYADTTFNRASFPLKTLEYLAAGRAAVSTPLPANDWLGTDLIAQAATPADFAATVGIALETPRTDAVIARRRAFAAEHSWDIRAAAMADLLGIADA